MVWYMDCGNNNFTPLLNCMDVPTITAQLQQNTPFLKTK